MPIKAVAETDQENKNEAESTIENDYVEQGIKRKCSVHSEFTEIPYSWGSHLEVESCFGGEDDGTKYIKIKGETALV